MTWVGSINYTNNIAEYNIAEYNIAECNTIYDSAEHNETEIIKCQYTDTYNILDSSYIKSFSIVSKLSDLVQYIDNKLDISVNANNIFEMLNSYETEAYMEDPIKFNKYNSFVYALHEASKMVY